MFKLIDLSGDEIRLSPEDISAMITSSCRRSGSLIEGVAVRRDRVILIAGDDPAGEDRAYRFTRLGDHVSPAELTAVLRCRYDNDFRTIGAFALSDGYWTLTEKIIN